jgi:hypothetical protein
MAKRQRRQPNSPRVPLRGDDLLLLWIALGVVLVMAIAGLIYTVVECNARGCQFFWNKSVGER